MNPAEDASPIRLYWAIRPNGLVYGPVTKVPTNHPADWVIIHTDGIPEEQDAS